MLNAALVLEDHHSPTDSVTIEVVSAFEARIHTSDSVGKGVFYSFEPKTILDMAEFLGQFSYCPDCHKPIHRSEASHTCPIYTHSTIQFSEDEIPF